jgi:protein-S-isoprenylcysteine O-methyltransferase Ste14
LALATALVGRAQALAPVADQILNCAGLALAITACLGRIWCSSFIAGHKNKALITVGPYSLCRHPLYAFSLIGAAGMGLATRSIVLTLVTVLFMVFLLLRAATREDRFLARVHTDAFAAYARTTPGWGVRLRNYHVPSTVTISPKVFRKSLFDAAAFLALYLIIDTIRALRESGVFPTVVEIP